MKSLPLVRVNRRLLPALDRSMELVQPALRELLDALASSRGRWPLFLHGDVGAGKTCAALALCDIVETAVYLSHEDLVTRTIAGDEHLKHQFETKALVVLDEIGAREKVGDAQYSTLKAVLDAREQRHQRVGIYISNVSPARIAALFDDRLASRLLCGTCFELVASDRRFAR